jgi:hypothetical protein
MSETTMSVLTDIERYRHEIATDTYTTTWREVLGQFKDGDLKIDPEYQRLFRWDIDQQTQYIESILLNIPSPPLFLATNPTGDFEVIDGLQRVSTLLKFFSVDVFKDIDPPSFNNNGEAINNIYVPTILAPGPIIESLEGFTSTTLPEALVRTIRYARITIILLEKESTPRARYEVFKRLNKQGSLLSDQEIRNCTSRIFGTEFPTRLRELGNEQVINDALSLSEEDRKKMRVEEMILRLLAFNHNPKTPKHEVSEFLDEFMAYASAGKFKLEPDATAKIIKTFDLINSACPDGRAFRFPKSGFSTNLFDVVATGVYKNIDTLDVITIAHKVKELIVSDKIKEVTGGGSNTRKKMEGRTSLGETWFTT